jgi:SAM-dependent methyltransferase
MYLNLERMSSYVLQYNMVLDAIEAQRPGDARILEIGGSNNILRAMLTHYFESSGISARITTCDSDADSRPDCVADVRSLSFEDEAFDITACFQVLEHLPFSDFPAALREIRRVTRHHVLISLPHVSLYLSGTLKIPRRQAHPRFLPLGDPRFLRLAASGSYAGHQWEIGYRGFGIRKIREIMLDSGLEIAREFRYPLFPVHHFFVLRIGS